jgi:hypothetical protein
MIIVCCQVRHGVESLKSGLSEWQFNIWILDLGGVWTHKIYLSILNHKWWCTRCKLFGFNYKRNSTSRDTLCIFPSLALCTSKYNHLIEPRVEGQKIVSHKVNYESKKWKHGKDKELGYIIWGDFLSLYSQFYEVTILESTHVIDEGNKMQSVFLDVKLCL